MLKALLIIFVIAKLLGLITWSWWIVLCPLFIELVMFVILSIVALISNEI